MSNKTSVTQTRSQLLDEFYAASNDALFNQTTVAAVIGCSTAKLERDRWSGCGIQFLKIGRAVKYQKSGVLAWLAKYQPQQSTSA